MGANDDSNDLLENQIAKQNAEIQEKTETMADERLNLIKSQGAPSWDSARASPRPKAPPQGWFTGSGKSSGGGFF
jgi:hypothetical protein